MAFFKSIKTALSKTTQLFKSGLSVFLGKKTIDEDTLEALTTLLLKADLGVSTTEYLVAALQKRLAKEDLDIVSALKLELALLLQPAQKEFCLDVKAAPQIILFVGVNGAGKTTSIGKLAHHLKKEGHSVLLAAGDTFRAAASEQLTAWAHRNKLPIVAAQPGSDSASVLFDALHSARTKGIEVVLADTAGRLQNKQHLMEELKKVTRVLKKQDPNAPHEVLLVLDAGIGQNALQQVREFNAALPLTGLILTKLDGTAKAGVIFAIMQECKLPIYFIGTGEAIDQLTPFDATAFIEALFEEK